MQQPVCRACSPPPAEPRVRAAPVACASDRCCPKRCNSTRISIHKALLFQCPSPPAGPRVRTAAIAAARQTGATRGNHLWGQHNEYVSCSNCSFEKQWKMGMLHAYVMGITHPDPARRTIFLSIHLSRTSMRWAAHGMAMRPVVPFMSQQHLVKLCTTL